MRLPRMRLIGLGVYSRSCRILWGAGTDCRRGDSYGSRIVPWLGEYPGHFITHVTCPECALNGSATWEEDEKGNLEATVRILSPGFTVGPGSEIDCVECGVKAQIGQTLSRSEKGTATSN